MKKINLLLMAAAMTVGLASCSKVDNTTLNPTTVESKLIIKEMNFGGGFKTTAGKSYSWCKGLVLYNNGSKAVTYKNLAIGAVPPGNAHANNNNYGEDGKLVWENADWTPIWATVWYIPEITIEPFSDAVIAVNGAIDHTQIAPEAFDLSDASYYAMYDPESGLNNANAYPEPTNTPADHIWKAVLFGKGNAWAVSVMCPALVLFQFPEGTDIPAYCADKNNFYYDGKETQAQLCIKLQNEWILDGVEFYRIGYEADSKKRLASSIDAGYGLYNSNKQYSAYRNIDEKATVNYGDNINKLVYNYAEGVEGTTDPSGIDAAASAKNGAKIIYQDTDNSTADFHVRKAWSLK